jgi:hypothetical protein
LVKKLKFTENQSNNKSVERKYLVSR